MADKKISQLTSLAQGDVAVSTDTLPIVDVSATETKKIAVNALVGAAAAAGLTSVDINSGAIDGTTIGSSSASTGAFTTLSASSTVSGTGFSTYLASPPAIGGTAAAAGTFTNLTASGTVSFSGATVSNGGSVTTVDINGGTIDGATIATSDITVGSGKTLNVSAGTLTLADNQISGDKVEGGTINAITINTLTSTAVNATTVDATNVEVTNVKAKDGTASIAIADSTGVASLSANPILSGGTANGVLYLNGSKVATSGSALTFDGTLANMVLTSGTTANGFLQFSNSADGGTQGYVGDSKALITGGANGSLGVRGESNILFGIASTEGMRLTSTGLGIGTSSPVAKLTVSDGTRISVINPRGTAAGGLSVGTDVASWNGILNLAGDLLSGAATNGVNIAYYSSASGSWNAALQIRNTTSAYSNLLLMPDGGNVGIGTSSPGYKLTVAGASGSAVVNLLETGVRSWGLRAGGTATNTFDIADFTAGATRLTIDSSGNLGLGVTPSAWSAGKAFELSAVGNGVWCSPDTYLIRNCYYNGGWKYASSAAAANYYIGSSGEHVWSRAASGTAGNAITFTQAMTLDASGNLAVGTTTVDERLRLNGNSNATSRIRLQNQGTTLGWFGSYLGITALGNGNDLFVANATNNALIFGTNDTERARITSGGAFLIGTTTQIGAGLLSLSFDTGTYCGITTQPTNNAGYDAARFRNSSGTQIGSISCTGADTAYNTSSDRRLKENIQPAADAGFVIDAIEVIKHDWKSGGHIRYGVIAQDLHAVVPEAVKAGDDGEEVTDVWGVDYSKLVPMLVKEIQSLRARVAQLENK